MIAITPDNRVMFAGGRKRQLLYAFHLPSRKPEAILDLSTTTPNAGVVHALVGDWARGRLLAAVSNRCTRDGNLSGRGQGGVDLVAIDALTLEETARVTLSATGTIARGIALSPDGSTLAVAASQADTNLDDVAVIHFLNASTLQPLAGSANPADIRAASGSAHISRVVFVSNTVAVAALGGESRFYSVNLANNFAITQLAAGSTPASSRAGELAMGPDGALWAGIYLNGGSAANSGFTRFPGGTGTGVFSGTFGNQGVSSIAFHPNGTRGFLVNRVNDIVVVNPANPLVSIGNIADTTTKRTHVSAVSPY